MSPDNIQKTPLFQIGNERSFSSSSNSVSKSDKSSRSMDSNTKFPTLSLNVEK
jgi:hypothetical protein